MTVHPAHPCRAQVWGEACTARRDPAACSIALASPYYFWDPAGFTADGSVENFKRRRQTELKHGRIWAPMDPQWSMAGITFTSEEPVFADDACMGEQSFGSDGWSEVLQSIRNRLMHAITGNRMSFVSFLFLVLSMALAVGCAVLCAAAVRFDLRFVINLCCCIFSLQCAMTLNAKRKSFKPPKQCRFVSRRRLKSVHNWNHRVSRSKWLVKGLCICSPFAMLCIRASVLVTMKHDNMMYKSGSPWMLSNKTRNRLMHYTMERTRWETTVEKQGIQLNSKDELTLPGDATAQVLRANQVMNGSEGIALCNQIHLAPKLQVRGGRYLLLVIPGTLGDDLRNQLNEASVTLIGNCFSTVLTCVDPSTKKVFPRQVVCINLGLQNVAAAELKPHVIVDNENSQIVCVSCFAKYNTEGWQEMCSATFKRNRACIIEKIKQIANIKSIELWGLKITQEKMTCFVRIPTDKAKFLYDCRDTTFFYRPFVSATCPPVQEPGICIIWANKIGNIHDLVTVTNTLKGVKGYVANAQSLGIRVEKMGVQFTASNQGVAGTLRFVARGFPANLSAPTIVTTLACPAEESAWQEWHVIPYKSQIQGNTRTWFLKADVAPSHDRLILPEGWKITFCQQLSTQEAFLQKEKEKKQFNEAAKAQRRANILSKAAQSDLQPPEPTDAWANWKGSRPKPDRSASTVRTPRQGHTDTALRQEVEELKEQFAVLQTKVTQQDNRLDNLDRCMAANHSEVMAALRNLSLGAASASEPDRKRLLRFKTVP